MDGSEMMVCACSPPIDRPKFCTAASSSSGVSHTPITRRTSMLRAGRHPGNEQWSVTRLLQRRGGRRRRSSAGEKYHIRGSLSMWVVF